VFGDYGFTMLVFADSLASLTDACTAAWSDLAESGMVGARETRALEPCFYSLVPGNLRLRPRPGYISSLNFASLASLHAFPHSSTIGYWGPPAALFTTIGRTLYYYHFHVGDVGNTFVCGRTGLTAGKLRLRVTWLKSANFTFTVTVRPKAFAVSHQAQTSSAMA
jgi:type IV secretion system protein VirB4